MKLPELFRTIATDARAASRIVKAHPELATEKLVVGASRIVAKVTWPRVGSLVPGPTLPST